MKLNQDSRSKLLKCQELIDSLTLQVERVKTKY